jgi:hypothetical protein
LELSLSSADASTQSSVFWSYSPSTGIPSASPRVISLFIWLPYVWTYLSTCDTEGYLRLRSRANPMHASEELSSFTIENAMQDSNKSSIQHYYNRTKQCCFAFIYWSKFIPTFLKDGDFFWHSAKLWELIAYWIGWNWVRSILPNGQMFK